MNGQFDPPEQKALDAARFWSKVSVTQNPSDCWPWLGNRQDHRGGYGKFQVGGRTVRAHRYAYEMLHGPIPADFVVMHACDNPICVNPAHLRAGTAKENMVDMVTKGRNDNRSGSNHAMARLTDEDVLMIRSRGARGETKTSIAKDLGFSVGHVANIINRKKWSHI